MSARKTLPGDIAAKLFDELDKLPDHPRVLVTVSHCYLELLVHLLAATKCKNAKRIESSNRDYPHSIKIVMLHEAGIIDDRTAAGLHWFRKLRNEAAHQVQFQVTAADLKMFEGVNGTGNGPPLSDPKNLRVLCIEIVLGFWNSHVEVFAPLFMPETFPSIG